MIGREQVVPLDCAADNISPNEHSKESPFFLMCGQNPVLPFNTVLQPMAYFITYFTS